MVRRFAASLGVVLLAVPAFALAQDGGGRPADKAVPTVEGVVVEPKPQTLPSKPFDLKDTACLTVVVRTLRQQYPDAFKKLSYWCMNQAMGEMAGVFTDREHDIYNQLPGAGFRPTGSRNASCDVVYDEAKKK